jgi:hypothetical protein
MKVVFLDRQDERNPLNGSEVCSSQEALEILDALVLSREPFFCSLTSDAGQELLVGVGRIGCVQHGAAGESPPYLMAVSAPIEATGEFVEFLTGGTPSPVPRHYCMEWQIVREVVAYFIEHGIPSPDVGWEEI